MAELRYTPLEEIDKIHRELNATFKSRRTRSIAYRKYLLAQLMYMIDDNTEHLEAALKADLGRPELESQLLEVSLSLNEIRNTYDHVEKWAKLDKAPFTLTWSPMRQKVVLKEPKGVVLVIAPFNYPIFLCIPLVASALAAGNTVVIKPSEQTPVTSSLLAELLHKYLDTSVVRVINGAIPETTRLLEKPWGHIMYTGSGKVGSIVTAAGKTLTPVTLELGGKSPVFIDPKYDLKLAARRILWGKCTNAGQTCVAPDDVMATEDLQDKFVEALKEAHAELYPLPEGPKAAGAYGRLVTPQALDRINELLQKTKGKVVLGGEVDKSQKYMAPTVVKDVKPDDPLMNQEIFGPILPIMMVKDLDDAIAYVNANDHPLTLYVFSEDKKFKQKVFSNTLSGSAVANDTLIIPGVEGLPFGGIGPSGSGYHTGKYGFDTFTHLRASFDSPKWADMFFGVRYPPYTSRSMIALKKLFTVSLPRRPTGPPPEDADTEGRSWAKWLNLLLVPAIAGVVLKRESVLQHLASARGWLRD
ncbi:Hexadecenal dehydrogenase [Marasmius tenuissimus]|nr:Hexadecenal dehydrogenase [Marasmius tenuissimus]